MTVWDRLPNSKHIARILADLEENPGKWNTAYNPEWIAAYNAALDSIGDSAWAIVRDAVKTSEWSASYSSTRGLDAIIALIAYDNYAYLLDEKPEHVQMLALLGNHAAVLLYPACVALQKEMA